MEYFNKIAVKNVTDNKILWKTMEDLNFPINIKLFDQITKLHFKKKLFNNRNQSQLTSICSKSTIETLEKGVKYVQS